MTARVNFEISKNFDIIAKVHFKVEHCQILCVKNLMCYSKYIYRSKWVDRFDW